MSKLRMLIAAVSVIAIYAASGIAQEHDAPKPGPEHAQLKKMEGTWDTVMKMGPNESKGTAVYKMDLGGLWMTSTFETTIEGQKYSGRGFDTYDANKKKYVGVWIDSMSTFPMMTEGTCDTAKKTMTMFGDAPGHDGKMTKHRMVTEMPDDNNMKFTMYFGDGKEAAFTIHYKRKK